MYKPGSTFCWTGRKDTDASNELWHQVIETVDLNAQVPDAFCFVGFCSDAGVKRNFGRPGAVEGPDAIRKAMGNLANHQGKKLRLFEGGDVVVSGDQLESAQEELSRYVQQMLRSGSFPILLGGGHEISYAHGKAVLEAFPGDTVGMINLDPHFDLRKYPNGAHSGSWARQLFDEFDALHYLPIGVDPAVNSASMFDLMKKKRQSYLTLDELLFEPTEELFAKIQFFADQVDRLCVTLDLDIFSSGIAPGVSALNPNGVLSSHVRPLLRQVAAMDKLVSFDVAEMCPRFDDGRTAKLAASMIYHVVDGKISGSLP